LLSLFFPGVATIWAGPGDGDSATVLSQGLATLVSPSRKAATNTFELQPAPDISMPAQVDSNSPAYWVNGELYLINSTGTPYLSRGRDQFHQGDTEPIRLSLPDDWPAWIEAVWADANNHVVFGGYHQGPPVAW